MSWLFKTTDPNATTFHPVSDNFKGSEIVGVLEPKDLEWKLTSGVATETQIYYNFLEDGSFLMVQLVHSSVGVWFPTVQITFKLYNPTTKETVWRSTNVSSFVSPPPGLDKRSCKSDHFTVTHKSTPGSDTPESFTITAKVSDDIQVSLEVSRPAAVPGWKIGNGPKAAFSYYGANPEKPDGLVFHSFWPRTHATGQVVYKGKAITVNGPGMYVHAVMGMRPDRVASRWNFADFQSTEHGGVSAIQMELTTLPEFGRKVDGKDSKKGVIVNYGSLVLGGKLACVTTEVIWPDEQSGEQRTYVSRAHHLDTVHDPDTSYAQPSKLHFEWSAPSILPEAPGQITASLKTDVGTPKEPQGLIEKVDVLAEIPAIIKSVISYVAGTKPYIYQWYKPVTLSVKAPDSVLPGAAEGLDIEGTLYSEASFVS